MTVIDFTVTMVGLEDQLLGKLILKEKNELEVQRKTLVEEVTTYKRKIKQLEDDLLFRLSNSQGNLPGRRRAHRGAERDEEDGTRGEREAGQRERDQREDYGDLRGVPTGGAPGDAHLLPHRRVCQRQRDVPDLAEAIQRAVQLAIDNAEASQKPATRIKNIIDHMTYSVYLYIQRGLFEAQAHLCAHDDQQHPRFRQILPPELVSVFLKGGGSLDIKSVKKKPKEWIPDKSWLDCVALSAYPTFANLLESMVTNDKQWQNWYDKEAPENVRIPDFEDVVTRFERMCLVKALREDRTQVAAQAYIADAIGQQFVESVPLNIEATWEESTPYVPIICLLSPARTQRS